MLKLIWAGGVGHLEGQPRGLSNFGIWLGIGSVSESTEYLTASQKEAAGRTMSHCESIEGEDKEQIKQKCVMQ